MRHPQTIRTSLAATALTAASHMPLTSVYSLCSAASVLALAMPLQAQAQAQESAAAMQWNIPAQPLVSALRSFASQGQQQLLFDEDRLERLHSQGVSGTYAPQEALNRLLRGTGIVAVPSSPGFFTLRPAPRHSGHDAGSLPEVVVTAALDTSGATEDTGSYTQTGPSRTSTGLALSLRETPQSISVVTRQRMDDFQLDNLTDVLEQTPGVTVDRQGDGNNFSVRGEAVNLQVDGMRQMASGWYGNNQMLYTMDDMAEIDRVEVLKGSSGLMSGDGKYGATVNMIRKRPTREFRASASTSVGSSDSYRGDVDVGGPVNASGNVRARLVAAASDGKDFKDNIERKHQMLYGTVDVDLSPSTLLNVGYTYRHREYYGAASSSMIQAYTNTGEFMGLKPRSFNPGAPWSGFEQNTNAFFGSLEHQFDNGWSIKLRGSAEKTKMPYGEVGAWITASPQLLDIAWMRNHINRNKTVALDVRGQFDLVGRKHELLAGIDHMRTHSDTNLGGKSVTDLGLDYNQGGAAIPRPSDLESWPESNPSIFSSERSSLYFASRLNLADTVKFIVGTRLTNYQQFDLTRWSYSNNDFKKNHVVTPYAGLVVDVHDNVSLYGSYASIFKPQSAIDASGKILAPEEGQTYEVGAKGEFFNKQLNASLAYFWMKTDNVAQDTGADMPDGTSIYRAVSGVSKHGYELELSGELAPGWQAQGSYVMNSSSLSSTYLPKHQFKLASTYRLAGVLEPVTIGAATRWQNKVTAGLLEQKAYWVVDLMAHYKVSQNLSLNFNVRNAFDKSYFAGIRTGVRTQYTWGAPRSYSMNLRYDF